MIEDEAEVREGIATLLAGRGWHARCVPDARAAAHLIEQGEEPDVLLVDYRLGAGASGLDAIRIARAAARRTLPALIVTGDTEPARMSEVTSAGFPVLHKPVDGNALERALLRAAEESAA